jgi:hypothetical protein
MLLNCILLLDFHGTILWILCSHRYGVSVLRQSLQILPKRCTLHTGLLVSGCFIMTICAKKLRGSSMVDSAISTVCFCMNTGRIVLFHISALMKDASSTAIIRAS